MPEIKNFPMLFKKASGGADQQWSIRTEDNVIITRWGQVGGAIQEARDVIKEGKNIGKKNETTPIQQAQLEAEAIHTKKLKKGYVKSLSAAKAGKVDKIIEGGVNPMLAHKFSEQGHKIRFPAFVQPKFDGHRCIVTVNDGKATMWTRTRKPITGLPHIIVAIEQVVAKMTTKNIIFDGELYNHDYRERFEELSSFIRSPEPKEGHEVVQYHIYDLADFELPGADKTQANRTGVLASIAPSFPPALVAVETRSVSSKEELDEAFGEFMEQGYEGLIVRNLTAPYVGKRSYDLQKVKEFDDAEFKVIGVEEGRGKLAGKAIFVLEHEGRPFRAKMKGKLEDLAKYVKDPSLAVGKMLTVRYFGISNANQVPRFPVGIRFRED